MASTNMCVQQYEPPASQRVFSVVSLMIISNCYETIRDGFT